MTRILDDGDDVGPGFGDVQEIATGTMGEFDGIDSAFGADDVGDVGDGGAGSGAEVEYFGAGFYPNVVYATKDGGGNCAILF